MRHPVFQSVLAGAMLAAAFPKAEVAGLAWVAPGLMAVAVLGCSPRRAFWAGFWGGLVYWAISLYWLLLIPVAFWPVVGWLALCAYLALYHGVWTWACLRMLPGTGPVSQGEPGWAWDRGLARLLTLPRLTRMAWMVAAAVGWVGLEMIRARLLTGFPWNLLGVSQYTLLPLVQLAKVTGVYGLSFVMVWTSLALVVAAAGMARFPGRRGWLTGELLVPAAVVAVVWLWGARECYRHLSAPSAPVVRLALLQPAVPQTLIWDSREDEARLRRLVRLSQEALRSRPDLLVWPEAASPGFLRFDSNVWHAVSGLARASNVWMVVGSDDAEATGTGEVAYYNSAFLISSEGVIKNRYAKRHLVMFGEYAPLARWLPFLKRLLPVGEGFKPGAEAVHFEWPLTAAGGAKVRAAMLICFEDVMAGLVRRSVAADTDLILNLTNDGWFRESAAQYQHAANAVFRAVETGRPLVRCTNNGRTCWVDELGRLREMESHGGGEPPSIYAEGWHVAAVPLPPQGGAALTFYHRHGDWFGWACVGATAGLLGWSYWPRVGRWKARNGSQN
ncbi:apolipoprotein N-acyltransferase [Fontisphaera persica]|uniref:apolipoprotein N-acyltransferase n=1 Tax=Fontisphaera persica TaxID=2974023 RepID=UPI0024BF6FF0|nr:apolipoprotein N-acyltransferase [Fontisphaera persica]WCJ58142.1 apolipoprotein N-acyltransferase [Fontisphaera persica]